MECVLCLLPPLVIGMIGIFVLIAKSTAQSEAKEAYRVGLEKLKREPRNADLREQILLLGRKYASTGVVGFDEVTLMNDVNAACARAVSLGPGEDEQRKPSVAERLAQLDALRSTQMVSEQEYQSRRQQILDDL